MHKCMSPQRPVLGPHRNPAEIFVNLQLT